MLAFFTILSTLFFLMTTYPFSKLHSNLRFPISHCETGLRDYIRMHPRPTSPNKASASYRNVSLLNGSMSSVTKVYLSANGHCERRSRTSQVVASGQAQQCITRFLAQHPSLKLGKPSGLDPKHTQCFNCMTVTNHFELLEKVLRDLDIPWENVWNMDEKDCQWGGWRKVSAEKYFILKNKQPCYLQ